MRVRDGRVVPTFFAQAIRGEPLTVFGSGTQTRSFCYIDDMVEGIYQLLESDFREPLNLGNPDEVTILEFASMIKEITGSSVQIKFMPLPVDDPKVRQPDISLAKKLLGWMPKIGIGDGLRRTHDYFLEALGRESGD
jgi:dTDP-glucose 4,6-dehydratase